MCLQCHSGKHQYTKISYRVWIKTWQACIDLLHEENVQIPSWICFSCVNGKHAWSGESFKECLEVLNKSDKVNVVGINCAPPQFIDNLICKFQQFTGEPIAVYPYSGEVWDAKAKRWLGFTLWAPLP